MGCDIHIIAEVKENGVWRKNTDKVFKNPYYEMYEEMRKGDPERYKKMKENGWGSFDEFLNEPDGGRNYDWFSVLADVRNGYGFAGVKTGEGFEVIAQPKGFPKDASKETMEYLGMVIDDGMTIEDYRENGGEIKVGENDYVYRYPRLQIIDWGCKYLNGEETIAENVDYHSYSYLSAKELTDFDWDSKMTMLRGTVSLEQYKELKEKGGTPDSWSGSVMGSDIVTIEEDEAENLLRIGLDNSPYADKKVYVNYHWMINYKEHFKYKFDSTVKPLVALAEKYEDARIVFAFDN